MLQVTYELWFCDSSGKRVFEPLTCLEEDMLSEARRALLDRDAQLMEVHRLGVRLFTIGR